MRDRIISPEECEALVKHAPVHLKEIIATGYYTGMRRGEILNLTWDKVDLPKRMVWLKSEDTKDKQARNIPIVPVLFKILSRLPNRLRHDNECDHVFLFRGHRVKDFRNGLRKACKDASIVYGRNQEGGFTFHDLRHTFNTNMRKDGVQLSVIMEITGHSTREIFDRYNALMRKIPERRSINSGVTCQKVTKRVTKWPKMRRKLVKVCQFILHK